MKELSKVEDNIKPQRKQKEQICVLRTKIVTVEYIEEYEQ